MFASTQPSSAGGSIVNSPPAPKWAMDRDRHRTQKNTTPNLFVTPSGSPQWRASDTNRERTATAAAADDDDYNEQQQQQQQQQQHQEEEEQPNNNMFLDSKDQSAAAVEQLLFIDDALAAKVAACDMFAHSIASLHAQSSRVMLWHSCLMAKRRDEFLEHEARWVLLAGWAATKLRVKKRKLFSTSVARTQRQLVAVAARERQFAEREAHTRAVQSGVLSREPRVLALALQILLHAQEVRRAVIDGERSAREHITKEARASEYAATMHELDRENVVIEAARQKRRRRWEQLDPFLVRRRMPLVANAGMVFLPAPPREPDDEELAADEEGRRRARETVRTRTVRSAASGAGYKTIRAQRASSSSSASGGADCRRGSGDAQYGTTEAALLAQGRCNQRPVPNRGRSGHDPRGFRAPEAHWWPHPPPPRGEEVEEEPQPQPQPRQLSPTDTEPQPQPQPHAQQLEGRGSRLSQHSSNSGLPPRPSSSQQQQQQQQSSAQVPLAAIPRPPRPASSASNRSSGSKHSSGSQRAVDASSANEQAASLPRDEFADANDREKLMIAMPQQPSNDDEDEL